MISKSILKVSLSLLTRFKFFNKNDLNDWSWMKIDNALSASNLELIDLKSNDFRDFKIFSSSGMKIDGNRWNSITIYGNLWKSLIINANR